MMLRTLPLLAALFVAGCSLIDATSKMVPDRTLKVLTMDFSALNPRQLFASNPRAALTRLDLLVEQFSATAFDAEYGPRRNSLRRIDADITVRIVEPNFGMREPILAAIAELGELMARPITVLEPRDLLTPANVIFTFNTHNHCAIGTHGEGLPIFAQIGSRRCVEEEVYQALALDNEACHVQSILCPGRNVTAYNEDDAILLRTAYDPRLNSGMKRREALPIARGIIAELMVE